MRPRGAFVALSVALLAGCLLPSTPTACATPPSPPLRMDLEVDDACAFFTEEGTRVRMTLRPFSEVQDLRAGVVLSEGVERVGGDLAFEGDARGEVVREAVLRAKAPGRHVLYAWTDAPELRSYGMFAAPSSRLAVVGDAQEARTEPAPGSRPVSIVRVGAEDGNASRLVFTVLSSVTMDATVLVWISWPPFPDEEGTRMEGHPEWVGERAFPGGIARADILTWRGRLQEAEPFVLRFHAPLPPSEGEWTVGATLLPDPRIDNGAIHDEVGWRLQGGQGSVVDRSP